MKLGLAFLVRIGAAEFTRNHVAQCPTTLVVKTRYIIVRAQCKMKMWGSCSLLIFLFGCHF